MAIKEFAINLIRFGLIGFISLLAFLIVYIVLDPFKVIYKYNNYYDVNAKGYVVPNRDYVSTQNLINNCKESNVQYNSFIFGNSRSLFYQVSDWKKHLSSKSICYHFDASGEGLWSMNKKVEFIDHQGLEIENVLLLLDHETLVQDKPKQGHLYVISPILVENDNLIDFHLTFLKAFLSPKFLYAYLDFKLSGKVKSYMKKKYLLNDAPFSYDIGSNEIRYDFFEELINKNKYYTEERMSVFKKRGNIKSYSPVCIGKSQNVILINIRNIFKKHRTDFKIIINPLYNQIKLNDTDIRVLKDIFGADKVFDFSGINKFTSSYKNYYESSHYRPHVAREIIDEIYSNKQ